MKTFTKLLIFPLTLITSFQAVADDKFTFGAGIGSFYSGVGINAGIQSKNDFKYVSLGCVGYSSSKGETCGAGIGWVKTDIFDSKNTKHGPSIYLGVVGTENNYFDNDPIYGLGVGYHYFFRGIDKSGFNLGFTMLTGNEKDGLAMGGMFQLGYQF